MKFVHAHFFHERATYDEEVYLAFDDKVGNDRIDEYIMAYSDDEATEHMQAYLGPYLSDFDSDRDYEDYYLEACEEWEFITKEEYDRNGGEFICLI